MNANRLSSMRKYWLAAAMAILSSGTTQAQQFGGFKAPDVKAPQVRMPEMPKAPQVRMPEIKQPQVRMPEMPKAVQNLPNQAWKTTQQTGGGMANAAQDARKQAERAAVDAYRNVPKVPLRETTPSRLYPMPDTGPSKKPTIVPGGTKPTNTGPGANPGTLVIVVPGKPTPPAPVKPNQAVEILNAVGKLVDGMAKNGGNQPAPTPAPQKVFDYVPPSSANTGGIVQVVERYVPVAVPTTAAVPTVLESHQPALVVPPAPPTNAAQARVDQVPSGRLGQRIAEVLKGTAQRAGLQPGDIILTVNNIHATSYDTYLAGIQAGGENAEIVYFNADDKRIEIKSVKVVEGRIGVKLEDAVLGEPAAAESAVEVLRITAVERGPAGRAGLQAGDLLLGFNGRRIAAPADLETLARAGEEIEIAFFNAEENKMETRKVKPANGSLGLTVETVAIKK